MTRSDHSHRQPPDEPNVESAGKQATEPRAEHSMNPADRRLDESPLSPNELDQTDESEKAADITRAGKRTVRETQKGQDCPGESPQASAPCAPDGKSADRYAG